MAKSKTVKGILDDMRNTVNALYAEKLVRDYNPASCYTTAKDTHIISFPGKDTNICNIVYDQHISGE